MYPFNFNQDLNTFKLHSYWEFFSHISPMKIKDTVLTDTIFRFFFIMNILHKWKSSNNVFILGLLWKRT